MHNTAILLKICMCIDSKSVKKWKCIIFFFSAWDPPLRESPDSYSIICGRRSRQALLYIDLITKFQNTLANIYTSHVETLHVHYRILCSCVLFTCS